MKICFFCADISKTGGTERVTLLIANELCSRGFEVIILSYMNGETTGFECDKHIKVDSLHLENVNRYFSRKIQPYSRLLKFLNENKIDVLINVDVLLCLYSLPIKLFIKTKMIAWEHFNFRNNNGVRNRDIARRLAMKFANQIVVLTERDLIEYTKSEKVKAPITYIYNPSVGNETLIDYKKRQNNVIAVGRLSYIKNFIELIDIWKILMELDDKSEWQLIICGEGEERAEIEKKIKLYGLKNVKLIGFCSNIEEYYQKSKIMVLTSHMEGFPMVLLEAQKHGLPIVSYDCFTGPSEIVLNGKDGYIVEYKNKQMFADKLLTLMNDDNCISKFSINAVEDAKRFNIDKIIEQWIELLSNLREHQK